VDNLIAYKSKEREGRRKKGRSEEKEGKRERERRRE